MQKVLTAIEMREIDRLTTKKYGIPSLLLMENAAHAVARAITEKLGGSVANKSFLILCGKGNNGGDGAALARILWTQGADVEVCLFGSIEETKGDARINFEILQKLAEQEFCNLTKADISFEYFKKMDEWDEYAKANFYYDDPDVLVDALFGTGLTRPLNDEYTKVVEFINTFSVGIIKEETLVVSIDIPSGLNADLAKPIGKNVCSDLTVTFTAPKPANILPPASDYNGELVTVDIGSPCELIENLPSDIFIAEKKDVQEWLYNTRFTCDSYKNKRGHALLVVGSRAYTGAAVLAGNAAMLSGVGLTTIATGESAQTIIAVKVLEEIITHTLPETKKGSVSLKAIEEIKKLTEKVDVVGIGCGLNASEKTTKDFIREVIEKRKTPVVIDADGLNALSPFDLKGSKDLPLILTPHEGEFLRLLGTKDKKAINNRIETAQEFAEKHNIILVLKGERTLIAAPDGKVVINPTGNSGLGKAGNGDTLTGIITGFTAQAVQTKVDIFETVIAAVYISGLAGDIAEKKFGKRSMLAADVRESLAEAFHQLEETV